MAHFSDFSKNWLQLAALHTLFVRVCIFFIQVNHVSQRTFFLMSFSHFFSRRAISLYKTIFSPFYPILVWAHLPRVVIFIYSPIQIVGLTVSINQDVCRPWYERTRCFYYYYYYYYFITYSVFWLCCIQKSKSLKINWKKKYVPRVRIELTTFRSPSVAWLWDWRAAYCATEAAGTQRLYGPWYSIEGWSATCKQSQ